MAKPNRVPINSELITWARERAGLEALDLTGRTLEGHALFQDAFRMLGMRKASTCYEAARVIVG